MTGGGGGLHRGRVTGRPGGAHWWGGTGPSGGGTHARGGARRGLLALVALLAVLLAAWEVYVDTGGVSSLILPAPHDVLDALYHDRGLLWRNFLVSAREIVLGSLLAAVLGFLLAIAMHFSGLVRRAVYPLAIASQAV